MNGTRTTLYTRDDLRLRDIESGKRICAKESPVSHEIKIAIGLITMAKMLGHDTDIGE